MKNNNTNQFEMVFYTDKQAEIINCMQKNISLNSLLDQTAFQYLLIYILTDDLINEYYKNNNISFSFPIDFYDVAEWLNINVVFDNLNYFQNKGFGKIIGELAMIKEQKPLIILEFTESAFSKRYALCHEISHYLLNHMDSNCVWAQLPNSDEEIICDIVASFFMLPPKKIFDIANEYTTIHNKRPVDLEELFKYLSIETGFPYYRVITAYEHLKTLACYLNNSTYRERLTEIATTNFSNDSKLYNKIIDTIKKGNIASKQFFL